VSGQPELETAGQDSPDWKAREDKMAWTLQRGQECSNRTTEIGQPEQDSRNRTAGTGQQEQDSRNRKAGTG
jgi:hypothetical protein